MSAAGPAQGRTADTGPLPSVAVREEVELTDLPATPLPASPRAAGERERATGEHHRLPFFLYALARTTWLIVLTFLFGPQLLFAGRRRPATFKRYLQSCGGGFVKLGQILAMRYDLLPAAYCDELSSLFDRLPPVPVKKVEQVIAEDLGRPVLASFRNFDPTPLGSASIAQVHAATLMTGEPVAVKVIRPGIVRTLQVDLSYLTLLGEINRSFGLLTSLKLHAVARELSTLTHEELDLRREARNADLLQRLMAEDEIDHYAPRVYFELSGRRVITMERIEGVPMTQLLAAVRENDTARLEEFAARGIRPRRTARLLLRSILEQTMEHRVFNADPHPANLIIRGGGSLAWVDFGMVGWLDESTWRQQFTLLSALASNRVQAAWEALLNSLAPLPVRDLSGFELETKGIMRDWIAASKDPQASVQEKSTARLFLRLFDGVRRARLRLPADLLRVYRTVIGVDMILLRLDPKIDWLPDLREFVREETGRQLARTLRPDLVAAGHAWMRFFSTTFNLVNWLDVKLPEMARSYQSEVSQLEHVAAVVLRYGRILLVLFVLAMLVARIPPAEVGWVAVLDRDTGPYLVIILVGALVLFVLMSRMLGELRSR